MKINHVLDLVAKLKRRNLVALPTPLERAEALSRSLGVEVLIKRDDLTGLGAGGNKLRKLEFIVGRALAEGYDTLLTTGGVQSNHARLTAAVAAREGLACELHLRGREPDRLVGNPLLSSILGASLNYHEDVDYAEVERRMAARVDALKAEGRRALAVPLGGGTAEGTVGYVAAVAELMQQIGEAGRKPDLFVVAGGTGSTAAGLSLGAQLLSPGTSVLAVSVSWKKEVLESEILRHRRAAAELLGVEDNADIQVDDGFVGPGYSQPSKAGTAALLRLARGDGILLDTTYTAKGLSGMIGLVEAGRIAPGSSVVFWHTGGLPELFTRSMSDLMI